MKKDPELEAYYAEASSWEADRAALAARSARTAWWVAGAAAACALRATLGAREPPRIAAPRHFLRIEGLARSCAQAQRVTG